MDGIWIIAKSHVMLWFKCFKCKSLHSDCFDTASCIPFTVAFGSVAFSGPLNFWSYLPDSIGPIQRYRRTSAVSDVSIVRRRTSDEIVRYLTIRKKYAEMIFDGTKKYEARPLSCRPGCAEWRASQLPLLPAMETSLRHCGSPQVWQRDWYDSVALIESRFKGQVIDSSSAFMSLRDNVVTPKLQLSSFKMALYSGRVPWTLCSPRPDVDVGHDRSGACPPKVDSQRWWPDWTPSAKS